MKSPSFLFLLLLIGIASFAQNQNAAEFQKKLNEEYANPEETPLLKEDLEKFEGLPFFEINDKFIVTARFIRTAESKPFEMKTTTERLPIYEKYGEAHFEIEGKAYVLSIYQGHKTREMEEYKNHLFLPYTDATNGNESYGGGRFIDLLIPEGNEIIIDFNKSYNPLCAYNHKYSCPIPPQENDLNLRIEAGVKYVPKDH